MHRRPERASVNYALLRVQDTLIGGAIALIFGYLLWPNKTRHQHFAHPFQENCMRPATPFTGNWPH